MPAGKQLAGKTDVAHSRGLRTVATGVLYEMKRRVIADAPVKSSRVADRQVSHTSF